MNVDAKKKKISKLNWAIYKKAHTSQLSPKKARLTQHSKTNQCNSPHKHTAEKLYDHLNRWRKAFHKSCHSFYDKNSQKLRIEGTFLSLMKSIYQKPYSYHYTSWWEIEHFLLEMKTKARVSSLTTPIQHPNESPS